MSDAAMRRLHRCLLFVPGSRPALLEKAERSGADALILDLEDAVADSEKAAARRHVADWVSRSAGLPVFVRVNHDADGRALAADLAALAGAGPAPVLQGVLLPKVVSAAGVLALERELGKLEWFTKRASGSLGIVPLIEDCLGLRNVFEIAAASPRVVGMGLASAEEGDLIADVGGRWTPDGHVLAYPRGRMVCEARAAGIVWLIDGAFMNLGDDAALRREAALARDMGFVAKMAIHPAQVGAILDVYSPTVAEIAAARALLAAFRTAEAAGQGAIRHGGRMVDRANLRVAERVLALAGVGPEDAPG